jgi:methionine biosynthesis protein MetW
MSPLDASGYRRGQIRADLQLIAQMIQPGARVLDVGCGDGALLDLLVHEKDAVGRGIEISQAGVNACVSHGLSAVQGDADTDLKDYPSNAFDYVVLSQTLQATRQPREVLQHMVRIGRRAIVSFPNFGHWRVRMSLMFGGAMPMSRALPDRWYETPNIHLCTIHDFRTLCVELDVEIERSLALNDEGHDKRIVTPRWANLLAEHGLFVLRGDNRAS